MKRLIILNFLIAILFCANASAQDFIDGWYFNVNEPGNGFNVNRQAAITEVALFDYTPTGPSEWFIAVGPITRNQADNADVFFAQQQSFTGSCFDCPFEPNVLTFADTIRVEFLDTPNAAGFSIAEVTIRGQTETYIRQIFGFAGPLGFLLGNWNFTQLLEDTTTNEIVPFSDIVQFNEIDTRVLGAATIIFGDVLSNNDASIGATLVTDGPFAGSALVIALDIIDGSDAAWLFNPAKENLDGSVQLEDDSDTAVDVLFNGGGDLFVGSRIGESFPPTAASSVATNLPVDTLVTLDTQPESTDRLIKRMPGLSNRQANKNTQSVTQDVALNNTISAKNQRLKTLLLSYAERLGSAQK